MDHLLNAPASAIGSEASPDIAAPWPIAAVQAERAAAHSLALTSQLSDAALVNAPSPRTPQVGLGLLASLSPVPALLFQTRRACSGAFVPGDYIEYCVVSANAFLPSQ